VPVTDRLTPFRNLVCRAVQNETRAMTAIAIFAAYAISITLALALGHLSCTAIGKCIDSPLIALALLVLVAVALFVYDHRCNPPRDRINVFVVALFVAFGAAGGAMNLGLHLMISALRRLVIG
jgi:fumarate reductase subunit D